MGAEPTLNPRPHRGQIFLEEAEVLSQQSHLGAQHQIRLQAPQCAIHARPGSFVHLQCDPLQPLRRPLSILRASPQQGWVELLYKVVGTGTQLLADRRVGERISLLGPIGQPFIPRPERPRPLLVGGGVGLPPMIFLAEVLRGQRAWQPWRSWAPRSPSPSRWCPPNSCCPAYRPG